MTRDRSMPRQVALPLSFSWMLVAPLLVRADPPPSPATALRAAPSPRVAVPAPERDTSGASLIDPFTSAKAAVPNATGQTLTAPVTVNANTATDGLTVNQSGTGRAISGVINNAKSTISALKGTTNGGAAALAGQNTGTAGPAGQFQITNTSSDQAALVSSTTGTGSAIQAIQGNTTGTYAPAVFGQATGAPSYGIGVEGQGNYIGVEGYSNDGYGVYGYSNSRYGVYGSSNTGQGVVGGSNSGNAVYGNSTNGYGVVGASGSSYAGYFYGPVFSTGVVTAKSFATSSDRNLKDEILPVDTESVLDRVAAMPISSWDFQSQPGVHHIGPMAQDFRAAFGLGADDTHIDLVDGVGVSLAAIQELQRQVQLKDAALAEQQARIESLEASKQAVDTRLAALSRAIDARLAALEQHPPSMPKPAGQP